MRLPLPLPQHPSSILLQLMFLSRKVNALRAQNGLSPVRLVAELNESSTDKATVMATNHHWGTTTQTEKRLAITFGNEFHQQH